MNGWVLLIDTDTDRLKSVSQMLLAAAVRVSCAVSGAVAESFLKAYQPDLILLHSAVPDAAALIASCRADSRLSDLPLLLLTSGTESAEALEQYFQAGIDDLVQLPPPLPLVLCNRVCRAIGASRAGRAVPVAAQQTECAAQLQPPVPQQDCVPLSPADQAATSPYQSLEGISYKEAVKNCGGEDILEVVFKKFYESIEERADAIQGFAARKDWKNYRIAVHSLKSSARLIGAMELSNDAKELEAAANELKTDVLVSRTPALLELYRSYRQKLLPLFPQADGAAPPAPEDEGAPPLTEKDFLSACSDLKECIGISDFDSADFIIKSLEKYRIPAERQGFIRQLKTMIDNVNRQEALALLSEIKKD